METRKGKSGPDVSDMQARGDVEHWPVSAEKTETARLNKRGTLLFFLFFVFFAFGLLEKKNERKLRRNGNEHAKRP